MDLNKFKNNKILIIICVITFFIIAAISQTLIGIITIVGSILGMYYLLKKSKKFKQCSRLKKGIQITGLVFIMLVGFGFLSGNSQNSTVSSDKANATQQTQNKTTDNTVKQDITAQEASSTSVTGQLKIHYINVGQGDSILIQQGNQNMLIDTGTNASTNSLMTYLQSLNIKKIDILVLTHPHEDHIGGADAVIKGFDIGTLYMNKVTTTTKTYKDVITAISSKGLKPTEPTPGETFKLGEANCSILGPINSNKEDLNTYSIVIKLTFGENKFLFTGDAQASNEQDMINRGYDLSSDVLKVGHHGSHTSTSQSFLDKVNPKYAVISVGKGNDYGHPAAVTMQRLQSNGIMVFRTDENGTIICTSDGKNISFNCNPGDYTSGGGNSGSSSGSSSVSPVVTPAPSQNNQQNISYQFEGDSATHKFHLISCTYAKKISTAHAVYFKTREDAISQGYVPCKVCKP
jgi:competence protein ComEC